MKPEDLERLNFAVQHVVGKRCSAAIASSITGSAVLFKFGLKVGSVPGAEEGREFTINELSWMLRCYAWRIERNGEVVCTSLDDLAKGGLIQRSLQELVGTEVASAQCSGPSGDITMSFSGGSSVIAFCCQGRDDDNEEYSFGQNSQEASKRIIVAAHGVFREIEEFWRAGEAFP